MYPLRFPTMLLFSLSISFSVQAQQAEPLSAYFYGKFPDKLDSLTVSFIYDNAITPSSPENNQIIYPDDHGNFTFEISSVKRQGRLGMVYYGSDGYLGTTEIIEPGDSIMINIKKDKGKYTAHYSGKGYEKYELSDKLKQSWNKFMKGIPGSPDLDSTDISRSMEKKYAFYHAGFTIIKNEIDEYREILSPQMHSRFLAEYHLNYYGTWEAAVRKFLLLVQQDSLIKQISEDYYRLRPRQNLSDTAVITYSNSYMRYLLCRNQTEQLIAAHGKKYAMEALYERLKSNYSGNLRDRLMVAFFTDPESNRYNLDYRQEVYDQCLRDALSFVTDDRVKPVLTRKLVYRKGTTVAEFALPNPHGEIIRLSDFRGKVLLLDIWSTGCSGCIGFARRFREKIYPQLKDEADFVKATINADKSKDRWLNSLKGGKYTQPEDVNLNTGGLGMNHPFIRYYDINAIPFVMLIDKKGRLYSLIDIMSPPEKVLSLIRSALNEQI